MAADPWSIEAEARELCGCAHCRGVARPRCDDCTVAYCRQGIKAGLTHAAEMAQDGANVVACGSGNAGALRALLSIRNRIRSLLSQ